MDVDKIKELDVTYIDSYYTIYPVGAGFGPYFLAYSECMSAFAKEQAMIAPYSRYLSERYLRCCVAKYMKIYRNNYGYKWALEKWQLPYASIYYETYMDTCKRIGDYLSGRRVFKFSHYFKVSYLKIVLRESLYKIMRR